MSNRYQFSSDNGKEATPVPIPNTAVKLFSGENTWREAAWEDNTSLDFLLSLSVSHKTYAFFACYFMRTQNSPVDRVILSKGNDIKNYGHITNRKAHWP